MEDGGYHGIFRNCQHFVICLTNYIFNVDVRLPRSADAICGWIMMQLNWGNRSMDKRIRLARNYIDRRQGEKSQNETGGASSVATSENEIDGSSADSIEKTPNQTAGLSDGNEKATADCEEKHPKTEETSEKTVPSITEDADVVELCERLQSLVIQ